MLYEMWWKNILALGGRYYLNVEWIRLDLWPQYEVSAYFGLWQDDVKMVLVNSLYAWHEDAAVPFLMDDSFELLQPLRISVYLAVVLDVIIEASGIEAGVESPRINSPATSTSASSTILGNHSIRDSYQAC
ncbi:hypothetical protein BGX26_012505 [Mortierella sp. AD094]|nr:hypothetical protein BGX26_012505 [Mortierella sp. AD094]